MILTLDRFTNRMWQKIATDLKGEEGYDAKHINDIMYAWTSQKKKSLKSIENLEKKLEEKGIATQKRNHLIENLQMFYEQPLPTYYSSTSRRKRNHTRLGSSRNSFNRNT